MRNTEQQPSATQHFRQGITVPRQTNGASDNSAPNPNLMKRARPCHGGTPEMKEVLLGQNLVLVGLAMAPETEKWKGSDD